MRSAVPLLSVLALVLAGCNTEPEKGTGNTAEAEFEGDDPGECSDGADNDRDSFFDCDDQDCMSSPDCGGGGTGPGTGGGTGSGTGGGSGTGTGTGTTTTAPDYADLESFTIDYHIDVDISNGEGLAGICSCELHYTADGVVDNVDPNLGIVTFEGSWVLTTPPTGNYPCGGIGVCECPEPDAPCEWAFTDGIWWDDPTGYAWNTFRWDGSGGLLMDWVAHYAAGNFVPQGPGYDQYYITNMGRVWPAGDPQPVLTYTLQEQPQDLALFGAVINHDWEVTFTRTPAP